SPPHQLADLRVTQSLPKLEVKQKLPLRLEPLDCPPERRVLFAALGHSLGGISAPPHQREIVQGNQAASALITMPVGNQIVSDPIQPGREWRPSLTIAGERRQRAKENPRRKIFSVVVVANTIIDIVVNTIYIKLI